MHERLEKILFDGDEIIKVDDTLDLTKIKFERDEKTLDEFIKVLEEIAKDPEKDKRYAWLFNEYQRLYAAIKMFGKYKLDNPFKQYRWRLLDDPIRERIKKPGVGELIGVEDEFNELVNYIKDSILYTDFRGKIPVLVGSVATGKTNLVELLSKALSAYGAFEYGRVYTVEFDFGTLKEGLGEEEKRKLNKILIEHLESEKLFRIRCPAHENPISTLFVLRDFGLINEDVDELIDKINNSIKYDWHKIEKYSYPCPHCLYAAELLLRIKNEIPSVNIRNAIKFVSLETFGSNPEVVSQKFEPPDPRSLQRVEAFEGSVHMGRAIELGGNKDHPLALNFGLGGEIEGPSAQRAIIHFSEIYKADEEVIRSLLDVIQNKELKLKGGKYTVALRSVFIGTSNLDEIRRVSESPIAKTILRRSYIIVFGNLLVIDDVAKVLKSKIFKNTEYHIPTHFLERLVPLLYVLSTLEAPSIGNINIIEKALLYNGEYPHGREEDVEMLVEELKRESLKKDIDERIEGIRVGMSISVLEKLRLKIRDEIYKTWYREKNKLEKNPCVSILQSSYLGGIRGFIEDFIKSEDEINDETKKRLLENIIPIIFDPNEKYGLYLNYLARDVHLALIGSEDIINTAITYISMIRALVNKKNIYKDVFSEYDRYVDERFVKEIEEYMKVPSDYKEKFVWKFNGRLQQLREIYKEKSEKELFIDVVESLLKEDRNFRRGVEEYVIRHHLSERARDISSVYSPQNRKLVERLKEMGYCEYCAAYAIAVASELRPRSK